MDTAVLRDICSSTAVVYQRGRGGGERRNPRRALYVGLCCHFELDVVAQRLGTMSAVAKQCRHCRDECRERGTGHDVLFVRLFFPFSLRDPSRRHVRERRESLEKNSK